MNLTRLRIPTTLASFALLGVSANAAYQFIISGDPLANAKADSFTAVSSGGPLTTGAAPAPSASLPLESRFQTCDESGGIALRSDKPLATILFVR